MNRTSLKVTIKHRIVYVHIAVGRCYFCFTVYIILVFSSVVLLWSVFVFVFFSSKQRSTKAWKRVCCLSSMYVLGISKKAFAALGVLTSKVQSVLALWHLNEAVMASGLYH